eukprot:1914865-Pyramimonas_sp.AAC.1
MGTRLLYTAAIRGTLTQPAQHAVPGGGKVNQVGMVTEAAPGISLSNLQKSSTLHYMISSIPSAQ